MPTIRMRTTAAGPAGVRVSGLKYEVPAVVGWELVDAGAALWVDAPPPRPEVRIEAAVAAPPVERAVAPRGRKRAR